ncbi:hypothetical protein [Nesterenkonia pannonica]|uniref:hypothetical protein n=1 Tax=Nesterenkonia pannonica TaxID=1548602 RepID=UPI0021647933|nr:hypothetical protein [Nesterenkonia pannonica]
MAQLLLLIVAAFCIANKVYSPQFMLWLAPLIVLAAPRMRDLIIWHAVQLLHFWAIWMHLAAVVGDAEPQHSFDENLYIVAVAAHILSTLYICAQVVRDAYRPSRDVVRAEAH